MKFRWFLVTGLFVVGTLIYVARKPTTTERMAAVATQSRESLESSKSGQAGGVDNRKGNMTPLRGGGARPLAVDSSAVARNIPARIELSSATELARFESPYLKLTEEKSAALAELELRYIERARNLTALDDAGRPSGQKVSELRTSLAREFYSELVNLLGDEALEYVSAVIMGTDLRNLAKQDEEHEIERSQDGLTVQRILHMNQMALPSHLISPKEKEAILSQSLEFKRSLSEATLYQLADEKLIRLQNRSGVSGISSEGIETVYYEPLQLSVTSRGRMFRPLAMQVAEFAAVAAAKRAEMARNMDRSFLEQSRWTPEQLAAFKRSPLGAFLLKY